MSGVQSAAQTFTGGFTSTGMTTLPESAALFGNNFPRAAIAQAATQKYLLPIQNWRVFDACQTLLPQPSANDDLGIYYGTHGTNSPQFRTYDVKSGAALSFYARYPQFMIPREYDDGETITLCAYCGMETTVADNSCTIDFAVFKSDGEYGVTGGDLVGTAAQDMNLLTYATRTFTITAASVDPGDILDILMTVAVNDASGVAAVIAAIGSVYFSMDIR